MQGQRPGFCAGGPAFPEGRSAPTIDRFPASTPSVARARVPRGSGHSRQSGRASGSYQVRPVKELLLRGISTKEAANAYAPHFIADFNGRFGKVPRSTFDAHRPLRVAMRIWTPS